MKACPYCSEVDLLVEPSGAAATRGPLAARVAPSGRFMGMPS
jgi:hypothetical protein